ncbi:MAG: hypothetical protein MR018_00885 [Clostridiales bacterium]|nr:hypothetical protein [Clostridiales bacterium]
MLSERPNTTGSARFLPTDFPVFSAIFLHFFSFSVDFLRLKRTFSSRSSNVLWILSACTNRFVDEAHKHAGFSYESRNGFRSIVHMHINIQTSTFTRPVENSVEAVGNAHMLRLFAVFHTMWKQRKSNQYTAYMHTLFPAAYGIKSFRCAGIFGFHFRIRQNPHLSCPAKRREMILTIDEKCNIIMERRIRQIGAHGKEYDTWKNLELPSSAAAALPTASISLH